MVQDHLQLLVVQKLNWKQMDILIKFYLQLLEGKLLKVVRVERYAQDGALHIDVKIEWEIPLYGLL